MMMARRPGVACYVRLHHCRRITGLVLLCRALVCSAEDAQARQQRIEQMAKNGEGKLFTLTDDHPVADADADDASGGGSPRGSPTNISLVKKNEYGRSLPSWRRRLWRIVQSGPFNNFVLVLILAVQH